MSNFRDLEDLNLFEDALKKADGDSYDDVVEILLEFYLYETKGVSLTEIAGFEDLPPIKIVSRKGTDPQVLVVDFKNQLWAKDYSISSWSGTEELTEWYKVVAKTKTITVYLPE